jgi:hypothetical protein
MTSAEITNRPVPGVASAATRPHLDALFDRTDPKRSRLIFVIDATASRQPTWDQAAHLQSESGFVSTSPNPWNYPAKHRSGRLDQLSRQISEDF